MHKIVLSLVLVFFGGGGGSWINVMLLVLSALVIGMYNLQEVSILLILFLSFLLVFGYVFKLFAMFVGLEEEGEEIPF